jgi:hypothetical protein
MGMYINKVNGEKLPTFGKVPFLQEKAGAQLLGKPPDRFEKDLVCVVENAAFDAAVYAGTPWEMRYYMDSGGRTTHWLIVPNAKDLVGPYEPDQTT